MKIGNVPVTKSIPAKQWAQVAEEADGIDRGKTPDVTSSLGKF